MTLKLIETGFIRRSEICLSAIDLVRALQKYFSVISVRVRARPQPAALGSGKPICFPKNFLEGYRSLVGILKVPAAPGMDHKTRGGLGTETHAIAEILARTKGNIYQALTRTPLPTTTIPLSVTVNLWRSRSKSTPI